MFHFGPSGNIAKDMVSSQTGDSSDGANLATDGNINSDLIPGACANPTPPSSGLAATWTIVFERTFHIYQVIVYPTGNDSAIHKHNI